MYIKIIQHWPAKPINDLELWMTLLRMILVLQEPVLFQAICRLQPAKTLLLIKSLYVVSRNIAADLYIILRSYGSCLLSHWWCLTASFRQRLVMCVIAIEALQIMQHCTESTSHARPSCSAQIKFIRVWNGIIHLASEQQRVTNAVRKERTCCVATYVSINQPKGINIQLLPLS